MQETGYEEVKWAWVLNEVDIKTWLRGPWQSNSVDIRWRHRVTWFGISKEGHF